MKLKFSRKARMFKIATMILLVICTACLSVVITYAITTERKPEMNGSVTFTASGVNATITKAATTTISGTFKTLEYSTTDDSKNTAAETDVATWQNLAITFTESGTETLAFTITPGTTDLYASVTVTTDPTTCPDWLTINVSGATSSLTQISSATTITITFTADEGEIDVSDTVGFTISVVLSSVSQ